MKISLRLEIEAAPQGSKNGYYRDGKVILVESSRAVKPYREAVSKALREAGDAQNWVIANRDVQHKVSLVFGLPAPKRFVRAHHTTKPDIDKLARSTLDAITLSGRIWLDDSQVTVLLCRKEYAKSAFVQIEVSYGNS
jgi:Holliday junction resolvase RusA-like endonuclease